MKMAPAERLVRHSVMSHLLVEFCSWTNTYTKVPIKPRLKPADKTCTTTNTKCLLVRSSFNPSHNCAVVALTTFRRLEGECGGGVVVLLTMVGKWLLDFVTGRDLDVTGSNNRAAFSVQGVVLPIAHMQQRVGNAKTACVPKANCTRQQTNERKQTNVYSQIASW